MSNFTIALFGEAEKGDYQTAYLCKTLPELEECLGNPPPNSLGLHCAIQALMYKRQLLYFRVEEEGFSYNDYIRGITILETQPLIAHVAALCLPGVGNYDIINAVTPYCISHHTIIVTNEADLYDFITHRYND